MAKNPIYLTNQELMKGIALLITNAHMLEKMQKAQESHSPQEQTFLQTLYMFPHHSAHEIAQKMHISKQALSRHLKKMQHLDYIHIHDDPDDRRVKRLSLSTKGIACYTKQQEWVLEAFYSAYQSVGVGAVEGFHRVQTALAQSLKELSQEY